MSINKCADSCIILCSYAKAIKLTADSEAEKRKGNVSRAAKICNITKHVMRVS